MPVKKTQRKVLAVASSGGHWVQLRRVIPAFADSEIVYVTVLESYRSQVPDHRFYAVDDATRWNKLALIRLALQLAWIIVKESPSVVVPRVPRPDISPCCWAAGSEQEPSGSIAWRISKNSPCPDREPARYADLWLTQWPHLAKPDGPQYGGSVL